MENYSPKLLFETSFKSHSTLSVAVVTCYTRIMEINFIIANHFLQVSQSVRTVFLHKYPAELNPVLGSTDPVPNSDLSNSTY